MCNLREMDKLINKNIQNWGQWMWGGVIRVNAKSRCSRWGGGTRVAHKEGNVRSPSNRIQLAPAPSRHNRCCWGCFFIFIFIFLNNNNFLYWERGAYSNHEAWAAAASPTHTHVLCSPLPANPVIPQASPSVLSTSLW